MIREVAKDAVATWVYRTGLALAVMVASCRPEPPAMKRACHATSDCSSTYHQVIASENRCEMLCWPVAGTAEFIARIEAWCADHPTPPDVLQQRCTEGPVWNRACDDGECALHEVHF